MQNKLVFPQRHHGELWHEIVAEIKTAGESVIPYALTLDIENYDEYLEQTINFRDNVNIPAHLVPATTYFFMDEEETRILGAVNIRHSLNDSLIKSGGHIGYGVRPSERRKGYATAILGLALAKCRGMHLQRVLLTCDKNNKGSWKTILNKNGILENEIQESSGRITQRYWIDLT